ERRIARALPRRNGIVESFRQAAERPNPGWKRAQLDANLTQRGGSRPSSPGVPSDARPSASRSTRGVSRSLQSRRPALEHEHAAELDTPWGQRTEWPPGGFRWFVILTT